MVRNILMALMGIAVVTCLLACQSDDNVTNPIILPDDGSFYGVAGYVYGGGYPVNGIECIVKDNLGNQWFNTGYSHYDPLHGDGWFECPTTETGPFPELGDTLRVKGRNNGEAWGASDWFAWTYPNVIGVWVIRYW
jgi:hypothetical protein